MFMSLNALPFHTSMQGSGEPIPLTNDRIQQFGQDIIAAVQQQMTTGTDIKPCVYFLPGTKSATAAVWKKKCTPICAKRKVSTGHVVVMQCHASG